MININHVFLQQDNHEQIQDQNVLPTPQHNPNQAN